MSHGRLRPALNLPVGRTIIRVDRWFAARPRAPAAGRGEPSGTSAAACTDFYGPGMNHRDLRWPIELLELRGVEAQRLFRRVLVESHQRLHAPALSTYALVGVRAHCIQEPARTPPTPERVSDKMNALLKTQLRAHGSVVIASRGFDRRVWEGHLAVQTTSFEDRQYHNRGRAHRSVGQNRYGRAECSYIENARAARGRPASL